VICAADGNSRHRSAVSVAVGMTTEHRRFTSSRINADEGAGVDVVRVNFVEDDHLASGAKRRTKNASQQLPPEAPDRLFQHRRQRALLVEANHDRLRSSYRSLSPVFQICGDMPVAAGYRNRPQPSVAVRKAERGFFG
jgi:hypothetical protein